MASDVTFSRQKMKERTYILPGLVGSYRIHMVSELDYDVYKLRVWREEAVVGGLERSNCECINPLG